MSEWKQNRPIHPSISSSWFVQIARTSCRCDISSSSNLLIDHFQGKFPSKTSSAVAVIISASNSCEKCRLKYLIMLRFSWLEYLTKNSKNVLCAYPSKYTHIQCILYIIQSGTFGHASRRTLSSSIGNISWKFTIFLFILPGGPIKVFDLETGSLAWKWIGWQETDGRDKSAKRSDLKSK